MKIYGPYTRKDGRKHVILYDHDKRIRRTISYPKYLMEQHIGRELKSNEIIHHKDGNPKNDNIKNLEILKRSEHTKLEVTRRNKLIVHCIWCGDEFEIKSPGSRNREKAGPFCSKSCSGKYGVELQNNRTNKLPPYNAVEYITYYRNIDNKPR